MSSESRIYRYSSRDKILLCFGTVIFTALAYIAWVNQFGYKNRMVIAFLVFSFLCLFGFLYSFYSVALTEKEIIVRRYFRESRLAWNDIYEVIPDSLDSFSLSDRTGDAKVFVSSQVKGYLELVGLIKQKRPDIWKIQDPKTFQDTQTFHKNPWSAIQYGLGGIGMTVFSVVAFFDGTGADLFAKAFMFCLGLSLVVMIARQPRKLTFQDSYLIISYYGGWKKNIHINHIKGIIVGQDKIRGALINFIQLKLENGKIITLNGYKEGMPILASAFEKWMKITVLL